MFADAAFAPGANAAFAACGLFGLTVLTVFFFAATSRTAGFFVTAVLAEAFDTAGFRATVLPFGFFAAIFLAVAVLARAGFLTEAEFRAADFAGLAADFAAPDFLTTAICFGRGTLTSPRMERPPGRAFAAAFTVVRPVGLLREVEAMGTTLGTVET